MEMLKRLTSKKGSLIIGAMVLVGVLLLTLPTEKKEESPIGNAESLVTVSTYTEKLEEKIRSLCTAVDGAGKVRVLVTLDCSSEFIYADNRKEDVDASGSSYSSDYLIIEDKNGTSPVTVTEIYPKIRGVAVVCDGGDEPTVKAKLTELLAAALGISSGRISVTS